MPADRNDGDRRPVAVITGGSQGLGRAVAERLVQRGWAVVVDARRADRLDEAVRELRRVADASGGVIVGVTGDVTDPDHRGALAAAASEFGGVDLVVHNASTLGASPLPALRDVELDVVRRRCTRRSGRCRRFWLKAICSSSTGRPPSPRRSTAVSPASPSWCTCRPLCPAGCGSSRCVRRSMVAAPSLARWRRREPSRWRPVGWSTCWRGSPTHVGCGSRRSTSATFRSGPRSRPRRGGNAGQNRGFSA